MPRYITATCFADFESTLAQVRRIAETTLLGWDQACKIMLIRFFTSVFQTLAESMYMFCYRIKPEKHSQNHPSQINKSIPN